MLCSLTCFISTVFPFQLVSKSDSGSLSSGPGLTPQETQSLLVSANLYEDALHLSDLFDLDVRPVLEGTEES